MTPPRGSEPILVVDGYGVSLTVDRGHLAIRDGVADERRERHLYRSERDVKRILVLTANGTLSLPALQWCADVGITVTVLDPVDGRILGTSTGPTHDDARLRRAQALAPTTDTGLDIVQSLLAAKLDGQAQVLRRHFGDLPALDSIRSARADLAQVDSVQRALLMEANAANAYFAAWAGLPVTFAKTDQPKVPPAWLRYDQRSSPLVGDGPRAAAHPVNALLNYLSTLAAVEATHACHALGLDPGLGLLHADKKGRDSLALDLIEPIRPQIDDYVLDLVNTHVFTRADFAETRDGRSRLLPPLTHELAATLPTWATAIAPHAETVAHRLADQATGVLRRRRPLSGKPKTSTRRATVKAQAIRPDPRCPDCGTVLTDRRWLRCPACQGKQRVALAHERAAQAAARLAELEAAQPPPSSAVMRAAKVSAQRTAAAAWEAEHPDAITDPAHFRTEVLPGLQSLPIAVIQAAIGVGPDAAWRIREGALTPHPRHWDALTHLRSATAMASLGSVSRP